MKKIEITAYCAPEEVAHCIDAPAVGDPGPDEVVFDVLAFPINPADISFCGGSYRLRPPLPATPGAEGLGRVIAVGAGVTHVKPGELVVNMQRENWAQRRRIKAEDAIPLPSGLDVAQAAMLRINPATALLLLEDHVALKPGDWVIQDVANSAVGPHLIVLAKARAAVLGGARRPRAGAGPGGGRRGAPRPGGTPPRSRARPASGSPTAS